MILRTSLIRFTVVAACTVFAAAAPASDAKSRLAIEAAFTKADANGDGKVTKDEAAMLPDVAAKFEVLDEDKDGVLSLAEFAASYRPS